MHRAFQCDVTPTAQWTAQQIVEAFPDIAPPYLLRDQDAIYGTAFQQLVSQMSIAEVKVEPRSPWQNPYCERAIGCIRRDDFNHVIVLDECHLRPMFRSYINYYHRWLTRSSAKVTLCL
jgi:hypothetical protein